MHIEYVCVGVHSDSIILLYMVTKCKCTSLYITYVGFTRDVNIGMEWMDICSAKF